MISKSQIRVAHNSPRFEYDAVADVATRDLIPTNVRFDGMETIALDTGNKYRLVGGTANANWVLVSGGGGMGTNTNEPFVITATDVANGYIDISNTPNLLKHLIVEKNGQMLTWGALNDYVISGTRITFNTPLSIEGQADQITVYYSYL